MKNKSKLEKIKSTGAGRGMEYPRQWLYLVKEEIKIKEITEVFESGKAELWEEAGVVELALPGGMSIDFEVADKNRADGITMSYLDENQVKSVFLVTIAPESYEEVKYAMEQIIEKLGGFFCGDTPDFTPVIK